MTRTVSFTALEEAIFHLDLEFTPMNIQGEIVTTEPIDLDRLREATATACLTHPFARARRQPTHELASSYMWEIPDAVETDPVSVATLDGTDMASLRAEFYGNRFDLTAAPPFRLLVVRGDGEAGGDRLCCCVDHVAADGVGALRILRSICQAYRGETPDGPPIDFETSRQVMDDLRPESLGERLDRLGEAAGQLPKSVDPPARIAGEGATDEDGWGFVHRRLDAELTDRLVNGRPEEVSVNDVLLAALHLGIDRWNATHGESTETISLLMPVNLRPREWFYDVVGMYTLFVSISTEADDRKTSQSAIAAVVEQTQRLKQRDRAAAFQAALDMIPPGLPVGLKRQLPNLLHGAGSRLLDTAVLSNLGRIPGAAPRLHEDDPGRLWLSPPCRQPIGVAIAAATVEGNVYLGFRHDREQFDQEAAASFADLYVEQLESAVA
ncbi:MAG: NRPS condensation-like uncharacterized protein [Natronomonas sp.]|jgi:NRPS condensation-like uncharacterized protein|uniref:condensation domain-containing protein n=1 Tax=Natronomonas sp. TaxID=2184060 RepID=UPI0039E47E25